MKQVLKYITYDNKDFCTIRDANKHLNKLYADKLMRLSHNIARDTDMKFSKLPDFINDNLDRFVELRKIKDDKDIKYLDKDDFKFLT